MRATPIMQRARPWAPWALVVVAVILIAFVGGRPRSEGRALDPRSTGPLGTKALVDTLADLGVDVSVRSTPPTATDTTALLLVDEFDDGGRAAVADWVEAGGTLVVTDVFSPLDPARHDLRGRADIPASAEDTVDGSCTDSLVRGRRIVAPSAVYQEPPAGAVTCFAHQGKAWLVSVPQGRGRVVALGGASALINANLGEGDNALLAVDLLAPSRSDRVVVLRPAPAGGGDATLWSLVAPRVKLALLQLAIAFVLVAAWRSRRLGRPVLEPQPVAIEASELVGAVGELMQRARARPQAATVLRDDLRRTLAELMGMAPDTPPDVVAEAVASRQPGLGADEVLDALVGVTPVNEDGLVALAQKVESVRARMGARIPGDALATSSPTEPIVETQEVTSG